jgi:hypothetical protein
VCSEKCPIQTCDYHIKGFSRKHDKNRHTLTHYKGTMVCGFCPGSGSAAEKFFNRADVFKRHLTYVHGVEQTPPNSRKKISGNINNTKKLSGYAPDATGKCSICSGAFSNAQDFYEHLDDCVLLKVQQEEPSEAINAARLVKVERNQAVHKTVRNNALPTPTTNVYSADKDEEKENIDDENSDDFTLRSKSLRKGRGNRDPVDGVQTIRRADAFYNSAEEVTGPLAADDLTVPQAAEEDKGAWYTDLPAVRLSEASAGSNRKSLGFTQDQGLSHPPSASELLLKVQSSVNNRCLDRVDSDSPISANRPPSVATIESLMSL